MANSAREKSVIEFERGERQAGGQDVSRATLTISPIPFDVLRRPIPLPGRGTTIAPGFVGNLGEDLDFFDPLVLPPTAASAAAPPPPPRAPVTPPVGGGNGDRPDPFSGLDPGAPGPPGPSGAGQPAATSGGAPTSGLGIGSGVGGAPGPGDTPDTGFGSAQGPGPSGGGGESGSGQSTGTAGIGGSGGDVGAADAGPSGGGGESGGPGDGSSGSGGDPKIICTELLRQKRMSSKEHRWSYRGTMSLCSPVIMRGYHLWAMPVVRALRRGRWVHFWSFVFRHRARELAYRIGLRDRPDYIGKAMRLLVEPVSVIIGHALVLADHLPDYQELYNDQYPEV